jgi:AcrR family transcriptional regulator
VLRENDFFVKMRIFFSTPLANQKKARYNMTRRTETVIFHGGATLAFTDYETEQLRKALLKETRHCAVTLGMKKTSVDQLTKAIGIAKGSFYKFYESKEMLFFAVLEGIHSELYEVADRVLSENVGLYPSERAAKAVLAVCKRLSDTGDMVFIENDAKLLLQRLPDEVKNVHYHDDETHIRQLLEKYDLVPKRGTSLAAATVRGLILTVSHKEQIGELYPQVLETLVHGACRELFE